MLGRILAALGGMVVLALFLALLAPFFVDWSSFRVGFEEQASRILGKKVTVNGSVDARILPFPSVTLHDVRVGTGVDGKPLVQVARFSMDMELAPFLSGEARIFDMRIEEPKARFRLLEDGTLDWMRGSRASIPARTVVLEDVHITNGEIELIDEQSGRSRQITGFAADLSADSLLGPWRGEGHATLDGYAARFNVVSGTADAAAKTLPLRLRIQPDAQPVEVNLDGEMAIADHRPTYKGEFTFDFLQEEDETEPVAPPPPGPRVKGGFELTNDSIRIPQYRLEVGTVENPYVVTGEAMLDTGRKPGFLLIADGQQIDVNRLGEGAQGKTGRDPAASARRRLNNFIQLAASIPIPQVPGRASLRLPAIVANDTTIRDITLDVRPAGRGWEIESAVATLPGRTRLEATGNLVLRDRVSFAGNMLVASNQPSGLADWLSGRVAPEIRQLRSAGFSAEVNLTPDLQRFKNLELAIGPATLKGRLERQSSPAREPDQPPRLSMNLAGDEIDIDAMRALASLLTGDDAGRDFLDHRVAASLKADRFTAFGVAAANVDTAFTIAGGVLSLERLTIGNVEGATISARGRMEGSLVAYTGDGVLSFRAADPAGFFAMLRDHLPPHPALRRLSRNAPWFADTELLANLTIGGDRGGAEIAVKGKSNGSTVDAGISLPGLFEFTGNTDVDFNASLENSDPLILLGQAGLDPLPFDADGAGRLTVDVRQGVQGPSETELSFTTPKTSLSFNGALNLEAEGFGEGEGHLAVKSRNAEPYLLINGVGLPQFGTGLPLVLDADLKITADALAVSKLEGSADSNNFAGELVIDRKTPGMPATGTLAVDSVDLAWLGEAVFGTVDDSDTGALSSKPFALPIFGDTDLALDLKADSFNAGKLGRIEEFAGKLTHRAGGIAIEDASGKWRGGRLGGRMMMSNGEGIGLLQVRLAAENADLSSLVWQADGQPVARGRLAFDMSVESTGKTLAELLGSASGSAELRIADLAVDGINVAALKPLMAGADKLEGEVAEDDVRPLVAELVHQGTVRVDRLVVPVTITSGEARAQNITASVGSTVISGEGRFDLLQDEIAAGLAITYDAGIESLPGGDPTVRLDYSGRLTSPSERIEIGPMVSFLSQRAFEQERRRVETLQASVLEKQRLRREVLLYDVRAAERREARERAEREKAAAEERALLEAEEAERRRQQEIEAAAAAARAARQQQEQQRQELQRQELERQNAPAQPALIVPPSDDILQQDLSQRPFGATPELPGIEP